MMQTMNQEQQNNDDFHRLPIGGNLNLLYRLEGPAAAAESWCDAHRILVLPLSATRNGKDGKENAVKRSDELLHNTIAKSKKAPSKKPREKMPASANPASVSAFIAASIVANLACDKRGATTNYHETSSGSSGGGRRGDDDGGDGGDFHPHPIQVHLPFLQPQSRVPQPPLLQRQQRQQQEQQQPDYCCGGSGSENSTATCTDNSAASANNKQIALKVLFDDRFALVCHGCESGVAYLANIEGSIRAKLRLADAVPLCFTFFRGNAQPSLSSSSSSSTYLLPSQPIHHGDTILVSRLR